ncbi:MAG TPA: hypothetical protein VFE23_18035 [Usitatibacter sp.]|jgi:hypothetical protein|nr:hypothetical protein [Usitatibacter sp.]
MTVHTLHFGDEGQRATRGLLQRLDALDPPAPASLKAQVATLESLDRQYGGEARLELEGAGELVDAILAELARIEDADLTLGVALWAIRHGVPVGVPEPVVNALAARSNAARGKEELAAVFGLMQGVIAHVAPRLAADLERSNPERPWRLLHANLAITAIRTEDPQLMEFAFDALDAALPGERAGFYAEALALALGPRVAPVVRDKLEQRQRRWTGQ